MSKSAEQHAFRIVVRGKCTEGKKEVYKRKLITVHAANEDDVYAQAEELMQQRKTLNGMHDFRFRVLPPAGE